jgi:hypothetical protein
MSMIQDGVSNSPRATRDNSVDPRAAARTTPSSFTTDTLRRNTVEPVQIQYDATVDGTKAPELAAKMGARVHSHARHIKTINDVQLRSEVAKLVQHAASVKDEQDMARLGFQAQDLLDRVNATPIGTLSEAGRQSAARAIVPLAQAGEFNDLLTQAKCLLADSSPKARLQGVEFMHAHGDSIHAQVKGLSLPSAAMASLEKLYTEALSMSSLLFWMLEDAKRHAEHDAKLKADRSAWATWTQQLSDSLFGKRSDDQKSVQRLEQARQAAAV